MEAEFIEADSDNLPKVSVDMVVRFFASNAEMKVTKCSAGASYGDSAIRFVQIKRDRDLCTVKCHVTPEYAAKEERYRVTAVIDEGEDCVQSCRCEDCGACPEILDACPHKAALVLWLHRRSEEPPATPAICYWELSKMASHDDPKSFIKIKDILGIKQEFLDAADNSHLDFVSEVLESLKENNCDALILRYFQENKQVLSVHQLCVSLSGRLGSPHSFLQALATEMTTVKEVNFSKAQYELTLWPEIWYGKIKDSMLHEAVHCADLKSSLVDKILGEDLDHTSDEVSRYEKIKQAVLVEVSREKKITIKEAGLLLDAEYPILGAAPDGVADEYTIKVKCPATGRALLSYIKDNKLTMKLWTQVQAQMYFSKKRKALFCVAHPDFEISKKVEIFHVPFDEGIVSVMDKAQQFWIDSIFPRLLEIYHDLQC